MDRDLGGLAEATLKTWTTQVNITANPATTDREGWDYILQFPYSNIPADLPLDLRPSRIECFIQVKGIETKGKRKSITLSNWQKLVNTPLPAFFLVIDFFNSDSPQNAYLIHIDSEWISNVLKRLREITIKEKPKDLNKQTIDLTWSKADRLHQLNGHELKLAIEKYIGDDFDNYVANKQKTRKEIGVEPSSIHIISGTFENIDDMMNQWVDFLIGVVDTIPFSKMTLEQQIRFGIPAEYIEKENGVLTITDRQQTGKDVTVIISNNAQSQKSIFPSKLYAPEQVSMIPISDDYRKVRIVTEIGDIIIQPSRGIIQSTRFSLKTDNTHQKLHELANRWRVIKIMHDLPINGGYLEISDGENEPMRWTQSDAVQFTQNDLLIAKAVDNAWFVAKVLDILPDIQVTLEEIIQNYKVIGEIRELCDMNFNVRAISGELYDDIDIPIEKEFAITFSKNFTFGELTVHVFTSLAGYLEIDKNNDNITYDIKNPRRVNFEHFIDKKNDFNVIETKNRIDQKLEDRGFKILNIV